MRQKSSSAIKNADTDINTGIQFGADLLQKASGGRALQGIYFTRKLEDVLAEREKLLAVPKYIADAVALVQTMNLQSLDVPEMELSELARKGFCVSMPTSGQLCGQGTRQASTPQRTSLYFEEKDLCLSKDALSCLKTISNELNSLSEDEKIKLFADFFERFGSHAIAGHIIIENHNFWGTPTQGDNKLRIAIPVDKKDMPILSSEQNSEGKKEDEKTTTEKNKITENEESYDALEDMETSQKSELSKVSEAVNKEECGKCKNTNQKNTESDFQCKNASENKSTKTKTTKTYNEKHEPISNNSDDDELDEEEINTQESTSDALSVPRRGCYLVPVWTLIERGGEKEYFPNASQVAADLKHAYDVVSGMQLDKPIVEDVEKLTEMATRALSALQNVHTGQTLADCNALIGQHNYLQEVIKETSQWRALSTASVTSLLSLLFLCSTPAGCFVPTTENSNSTDGKRHTVSQVTVERCEPQTDISASSSSASNAVDAQTLHPNDEFVTQASELVDDLMMRLGLMNYFLKRLDRSQFHAVRFGITSKGEDQDVPPNQLVSQFMHMLRIADSNIRHLGYSEDTDDEESTAEGEGSVHPMDLLLAVFLCADDLMRQHMFLRLSAAQVALPFVIPMPHSAGLEMPLWSFRVVLKSVLSSTASGKQAPREMSVCDAQFPIVCFVRYGESSLSKSRIANCVLNKRENVVCFFDRECNNNVESRVLMDGLAEIYWYCPIGKKKDDRFNTFAAIVNLRGDAFDHPQLAAYLHDIASVNVIFCTKANHEKMNADMTGGLKRKPLIWVSPDMSPSNEEQEKVMRFKNNHDASTVIKLRERIKKGLEDPVKKCSLSEFTEHGQQKHGIKVDDGCGECLEAKKCANDIIQRLNRVNPEKAKEELLPLSNYFFQLWCKADMESAHLKEKPGVSVEQQESEIERDKSNIRQTQAESAQKSGFLTTFIAMLRSLSPKGRLFFLRWMEIGLNARSSKCLAELRAEWADRDNTIDKRRQSTESGAVTHEKMLTKDNDEFSQKENAYTFGLEHCMREAAQMYEAMRSQGREDCNDLPRIAAELLRDGEPLELMDGDACYVPLDWVGAVLKELHEVVKGKKVFVLSVLGIQSSGKSTLLNTMFGLRFAVSAGRCTSGAFMQLVEIAEEHTGELGYDYVLVIDTEGLRSQELSEKRSTERDNKMASLVIGLANMTLINVYGESLSEVKDFLQIAVHAFLRMQKVKLEPGCVFVHQNVPAADAEDQTMRARRSLRKQLDEMTAEAAKQEGFPVQCFGDVIKSDTRSYYFSSLFMGDPPMASLNPSYGARACEVRNAILEGAKGQGVLSILDFSSRVRDLWMALRGENFVFCFKNTLEMRAYRKLEIKRTELYRNMRHGFVNLSEKLRNRAQRGDLTTVSANEIRGDAGVSQLLQMAKEECSKFIEDDEEKDTLFQWQERTIIHLENYFDECVEEAVRQAIIYIKAKECKKGVEEAVKNYEKEIIERTKTLAQNNKGKVEEAEGRQLFNDMFEKYLEEVKKSTPEPCPVDVLNDAQVLLRASFSDTPNANLKVNRIGKKSRFFVDVSKHLTAYRNFFKRNLRKLFEGTHAAELHVKRTFKDLVQMVMAYINDHRESDYSKGWFETIIENVSNEVERMNTTPTGKMFELHREFCFDALVHIFGLSVTRFTKMHEKFMRINHPANLLEKKRDDLYQYFTTAYGSARQMVLLANHKSEKIMEAYRGRILNKVFLEVANGTTLVPALNGNKSNLEANVLEDLINRECSEDLMLYVRNPREYYERFIRRCVNDHCGLGCSYRLHEIIKAAVEHYHEEVTKCMKESMKDVKSPGGNVNAWLDALYMRIKDNVPFTVDALKEDVTEEMQSKVECFQTAMLTAWGNIDKKAYMDNIYSKERKSVVDRVVKDVMKDKCGCVEHCPFCGAVCCCTLAGHDGDHFVLFHRPQAIGGIMWKDTNEASLDICSTLVKSECSFNVKSDAGEKEFKYKEYKTAGPPYDTWKITSDESSQKCWKWIVCRFSKELETEWDYKFKGKGKIPDEWKKITKEEAIASIT